MGARVASEAEQRGGDGTGSAPAQADALVDALWLSTLQAICGRAAHEVRGALNAVAVNLEVARSRSERPGAPASAVSQYAGAASDQLESVIAMTEAIIFLVRPGRGPVDLATEVARVVALVAPAAAAIGRTIELDRDIGGLGTTSASSSSARLAIGHCLLAAADASAEVRCVAGEGARPRVRIEHGADTIAIDPSLTDVLASGGIEVQTEPSVIGISFPR
jgi:signal transduction histidine kinase